MERTFNFPLKSLAGEWSSPCRRQYFQTYLCQRANDDISHRWQFILGGGGGVDIGGPPCPFFVKLLNLVQNLLDQGLGYAAAEVDGADALGEDEGDFAGADFFVQPHGGEQIFALRGA